MESAIRKKLGNGGLFILQNKTMLRKIKVKCRDMRDRVNMLRSSYKEHRENALAPSAEEGRGQLRKAAGSCKQASIRRCPNVETHHGESHGIIR